VVRPSYVLGGAHGDRALQTDLERYMREAVKVSNDSPVLLDRFLDDAIEVTSTACATARTSLFGGIMEHVEQAACIRATRPAAAPNSLASHVERDIRRRPRRMARALKVKA